MRSAERKRLRSDVQLDCFLKPRLFLEHRLQTASDSPLTPFPGRSLRSPAVVLITSEEKTYVTICQPNAALLGVHTHAQHTANTPTQAHTLCVFLFQSGVLSRTINMSNMLRMVLECIKWDNMIM